jgi:sugar diacid utilization regulator
MSGDIFDEEDELKAKLQPYMKSNLTEQEWLQFQKLIVDINRINNRQQHIHERLIEWLENVSVQSDQNSMLNDDWMKQLGFQQDSRRAAALIRMEAGDEQSLDSQQLLAMCSQFGMTSLFLLSLTNGDQLLLFELTHTKTSKERKQIYELVKQLHQCLEQECMLRVLIATVQPFHVQTKLAEALQQLRFTLSVGQSLSPSERVYVSWKLALEMSIVRQYTEVKRTTWLEQLIRQLTTLDRESIDTIRYFFQYGCSVSDTAKAMHVHRNTLVYRLDKIKQETGCDLRQFHDAMKMKLAWCIYHFVTLNNNHG